MHNAGKPIVDLIKRVTTKVGTVDNLHGNIYSPVAAPTRTTTAGWYFLQGTGNVPRTVALNAVDFPLTVFSTNGATNIQYNPALPGLLYSGITLNIPAQAPSQEVAFVIEAPEADLALYVNDNLVIRGSGALNTTALLATGKSVVQIMVTGGRGSLTVKTAEDLPFGELPEPPPIPEWSDPPLTYDFFGSIDGVGGSKGINVAWFSGEFAGSYIVERTTYELLGMVQSATLTNDLLTLIITGDFSNRKGGLLVGNAVLVGDIYDTLYDELTNTTAFTVVATVPLGAWTGTGLYLSASRAGVATVERRGPISSYIDVNIKDNTPYSYRISAVHPNHTELRSPYSGAEALIIPAFSVIPGPVYVANQEFRWVSSVYNVQVTNEGCEITYGGTTYPAGSTVPVASSGVLTATRPDRGEPYGILNFSAEKDGVTEYNSFTVLSVDASEGTVEFPDLTVTQVGSTNQTVSYTAAAHSTLDFSPVNVKVTLTGVTATINGTNFVSGNNLPPGQILVVTRPTFGQGSGTVQFQATVPNGGTETIQRTIIPVQQDTVQLVVRATPLAGGNATQMRVRVAVADPQPGTGNVTLTYAALGVGSITPASPQTILANTITDNLDSTGYIDFTITRPLQGTGRVTWTAEGRGRVANTDSADISEVPPQFTECIPRITASDGDTVTVTVDATPTDATVALVGIRNTVKLTGPDLNTASPRNTVWVFARPSPNSGQGEVVFRAVAAEHDSHEMAVGISERAPGSFAADITFDRYRVNKDAATGAGTNVITATVVTDQALTPAAFSITVNPSTGITVGPVQAISSTQFRFTITVNKPGLGAVEELHTVLVNITAASVSARYAVNFVVDNIPPAAVTNFQVVRGFQSLHLLWDRSTDEYVSHYDILWNTANNLSTAGVLKRGVTSTSFTHANLTSAGTRYYWVRAVDLVGLESPTAAANNYPDTVAAIDIPPGYISEEHFADDLEPIKRVNSLPNTTAADLGKVVFLTTDKKLYRCVGAGVGAAGWTAAVPTADLTGKVSGDQIEGNTITGNHILAGEIQAAHIASGAVTASKLLITDTTNIAQNPTFSTGDFTGWRAASQATVVATSGLSDSANAPAEYCAAIPSHTSSYRQLDANEAIPIDVTPGETFYITFSAMKSSTDIGNVQVRLRYIDLAGAHYNVPQTLTVAPQTTWSTFSGIIATIPPTAVKAYLRVETIPNPNATGTWYVTNVRWRKASGTTLIEDGAVTTQKVSAAAIDASRLNVVQHFLQNFTWTNNSPGANRIAWTAGQLYYDGVAYSISASNVTTAQTHVWWQRSAPTAFQKSTQAQFDAAFNANAGDALIALNEGGIANVQWNATEISGGSIKTGTLHGNKITANSITGDKILAGAITVTNLADTVASLIGGIPVGGTWTGEMLKNSTGGAEGSNPGEVLLRTGTFTHPNGYQWSTTNNTYNIVTSFESTGGGIRTGEAYLMFVGSDTSRITYSDQSWAKDFVATRLVDGQWHYDNNGYALVPFTPNENDCIVAKITRPDTSYPGIHELYRYAKPAATSVEIKDGAVTLNHLNFQAAERDKIVAQINATPEGIRIASNKIHIDGSVTFGSNYDPTTKETPSGAQAKVNATLTATGYHNLLPASTTPGTERTWTTQSNYGPDPLPLTALTALGLKVGDTISVSTDLRSPAGVEMYLQVQYYNSSNTEISRNNTGAYTGTTYQRVTLSNLTIPAGTVSLTIRLWTGAGSGTRYRTRSMLNIGPVALHFEEPLMRSTDYVTAGTTTIDGGNITTNSITASHLQGTTLSALKADLGEITAGVLRSGDSRLRVDANAKRITVRDAARERVRMGHLPNGDYGLEIFDANNNLVLGADGTLGVRHNLVRDLDFYTVLNGQTETYSSRYTSAPEVLYVGGGVTWDNRNRWSNTLSHAHGHGTGSTSLPAVYNISPDFSAVVNHANRSITFTAILVAAGTPDSKQVTFSPAAATQPGQNSGATLATAAGDLPPIGNNFQVGYTLEVVPSGDAQNWVVDFQIDFQVSQNSTNGTNGTWTTVHSVWRNVGNLHNFPSSPVEREFEEAVNVAVSGGNVRWRILFKDRIIIAEAGTFTFNVRGRQVRWSRDANVLYASATPSDNHKARFMILANQ